MEDDINRLIRRYAQKIRLPDGDPASVLSLSNIHKITADSGKKPLDIEIAALENQIIPEQYLRNFKSFSCRDQKKLLESTVMIIGCGGLGGVVIEILARIGVGSFVLIDGDVFEPHNLNRQLLCVTESLSLSKAKQAAKRITEIHPFANVFHYHEFVDGNNAETLMIRHSLDVIVDCLDNIHTRRIVGEGAKKRKTPLVSAAVAGSSGFVTVVLPDDDGLKTLYGDPRDSDAKGVESSIGCLPSAVFLLAAVQSSETIKLILHHKDMLRNKLLSVDLSKNDFDIMSLNEGEI